MKTFRQFLKEMPKLVHNIPSIKDRDESDLNMVLSKSDYNGAKKVSSLDNEHSLYHFKRPDNPKSQAYLVVHNKSRRIKANITGHEFLGEFNIGWTGKHSSSKFSMSDVYHHIVTKHQPLVSSSEHSPGSYKNWKKLSERPDIHMSAMVNGEGTRAHLGDDWHKNYEGSDKDKNLHKLVARKKQ